MSGLGISPSVMINRVVHEARAPGNHLLQVAMVRAEVITAAQHEQNKAALLDPAAGTQPAPITTGADIDRLV